MAIADLLAKLMELKSQLVANLSSMGVTADESEKLNTLIPKVLKCKADVIWSQNTVSDEVTSVNIPSGVTSIEDFTFLMNDNLKSVKIPSGVTSIGMHTFEGCSNLASVTIGNGVTSIEERVFSTCTSLKSVKIPSGVTSIGSYAFYTCTSLASVTIPDSVTSIADNAFHSCTSLTNIYYKGTEEQWNAITKGNEWNTNMGANIEGGTVITYNYTG